MIHRGSTRTVILLGRWAVKVPSLCPHGDGLPGLLWSVTRGLQANLSEREWSGHAGCCPVLWSLAGLVNVYPRCAPPPHDAPIDYDAIGFCGPTDRNPGNVGWLHGELVWLDYDTSWNDCHACRRIGASAGQPAR